MAGALNQTLTCDGNTHVTTYADIIRCIILTIVMILIITGNVGCLVVFNSPNSRNMFLKRVRYAMTSLCCSDLGNGFLVLPSTLYPALKHCWPFGETICKIEAVLIAAFYFESLLNMVLIAVDRYCVIHHPRYNSLMTSRKFILVILTTWIGVFSANSIVIFGGQQFYFDEIGVNCEPFYRNKNVTLSILSLFFFVPAIIFAFCYGSIYRTVSKRKKVMNKYDEKSSKRRLNANIRTSKHLAAITLGYVCIMSPWTISTLIVVAANVKLPNNVDFMITWLGGSNSFINCLIYGTMNRTFRKAVMELACGRCVRSVQNSSDQKASDGLKAIVTKS